MSDDKDNNMRVDTDLIRQLADLLAEKDLSEIEVEDSDRRIVVKRKLTVAAAPALAAPAAAPAAASTAPAAPAEAAPESLGSHPGAVKSPMVGTVYLSGEPGAPPFVSAGAKIKEGETLLIIEAMKVMNPIAAPRSGTVRIVCVQDAQPVEFDQVLVVID